MLEIGDIIKLNNNEEYILVFQTIINNKRYLYLITKDGVSDFLICELENDILNVVKDEELIETLIERFKQDGE